MTWHKFWKGGERYFGRFYCASVTLMVLKIGDYLSLPWTPVWVCLIVAFVGTLVCGFIATLTAPAEPQTEN